METQAVAGTLDAKFELYDRENPHVFLKFVRFAYNLKHAGRTRIGAKLIMERIRWDTMVSANTEPSGTEYKVNNNYTSRYARKMVQLYPEFKTFFSIRMLKS